MDQGTGDTAHGQPTPLTGSSVVKLELPWSVKEEPQDQPSTVYSPVQPMSDNTCGPLLSLNTSHLCQRCSAVFKLSGSLAVHLETFHGETLQSEVPVASTLHDSASGDTDKMPSGQGRFSTQTTDNSKEDSVTSSSDFVVKLEPPWSMKEEPQDQPSAVYSKVQPMSDNSSGSLLSLNTSHVCQRCSTAFVLFSSLELHMVTFHGQTQHDWFPMHSAYECCGVGYHLGRKTENASNYNKKKAVKGRKDKMDGIGTGRIHQEKMSRKHVCDVCSKAFLQACDLKKHKMIHTGQRPFVCDVCSKAFTQAGDLKKHKMIHTGHKPFVCDVCSKAFTLAVRLKMHKLIHTGRKPFACDMCSKAFTRADSLKTHKLIHTGHKPFVCDVCSKAFTLAGNLTTHKLIHTGHKPFVCDVCSKAFTLAGNLKTHKLIHTGNLPFACDLCSKAFPYACLLKEHKMIHAGCKPFVCDMCNKAFARTGDLKTHKVIHTGHKPFVCEVCSKAFTQAAHLKTHKLVHAGYKSFVCDVCSKAFTHSSTLRQHKLLHTGHRPFVCDVCGKGFILTSALKRHKIGHGEERS